MGFSLGRFLKKTVRSVFKRAVPITVGAITGGPVGALLGALAPRGGVGAGVPSIQQVTGWPPLRIGRPVAVGPISRRFADGTITPAAGALPAMAMGLSRAVVGAIMKLAGTLGVAVTAQNIGRVGLRLWRSVTALARRYPGVSILTFLTGLGLTLDEAGEFLFWGQTKKRRRRRGISGRDISITRRTLRRLDMFRARLGPRGGGRGVRRRPHDHPPAFVRQG